MLYVWPWMLWTIAARVTFVAVSFVIIAGLYWIPRNWRILSFCGGAALALFSCGLFLGGDFGWWKVGFEYGANRWQGMTMGPTPNLASILGSYAGWNSDDLFYTLHLPFRIHVDITLGQAMTALYGLMLLLCSIAAAIQDSRRGRGLLLAMITPWLMMFVCLPHMHERYLIWAAVVSALAAAVSLGTTLLHLLVMSLSCIAMIDGLVGASGQNSAAPKLFDFFGRLCPDSAWMVLLLALIFLFLSFTWPARAVSNGSERPTASRNRIAWLFRR